MRHSPCSKSSVTLMALALATSTLTLTLTSNSVANAFVVHPSLPSPSPLPSSLRIHRHRRHRHRHCNTNNNSLPPSLLNQNRSPPFSPSTSPSSSSSSITSGITSGSSSRLGLSLDLTETLTAVSSLQIPILASTATSPLSSISSILSTTTIIPLLPSFLINASLFTILKSKLNTMLTPEGFYHSLALGTLLWHTLGWQGWTTCVMYLLLGQLVTKVKFEEKEKMGIAEGRGGRRGPENVWGSAATGLLCAAASLQIHPSILTATAATTPSSFLGISYDLLILGYVSSLATKLADTFASEIGKAYGKTTFLITSFERVEPGTEGAVSAEGTAAAAVGGSLLPMYALGIGLLNGGWVAVGIATFAAFMATNAESWIGAVLQGKKGFEWMTNEVVNFLNTVIGATIAISLGRFLM